MSPLSELTAIIVKAVESANSPDHYIAHDGKIWLDDVLMAKNARIDADFAQWKDDEYKPPHGTVGEIKKGLKKKYDEKLLEMWLLGKPLSSQSPDTISFLLSLLRV